MSTENELLPCPFCGSAEIDEEFALSSLKGNEHHSPGCMQCGAMAETIPLWNQRATPPAPTPAQSVGFIPPTMAAQTKATIAAAQSETATPLTDARVEANRDFYSVLYPSRKEVPVDASFARTLERALAQKTAELAEAKAAHADMRQRLEDASSLLDEQSEKAGSLKEQDKFQEVSSMLVTILERHPASKDSLQSALAEAKAQLAEAEKCKAGLFQAVRASDEIATNLRTENERLAALVADHEKVHADHARWVRRLDVVWNGEENAAPQASLVDVVTQIEKERSGKSLLQSAMEVAQQESEEWQRKLTAAQAQIAAMWQAIQFVRFEIGVARDVSNSYTVNLRLDAAKAAIEALSPSCGAELLAGESAGMQLARREIDSALHHLPQEYVIQHEDPYAAMVLTFNKLAHVIADLTARNAKLEGEIEKHLFVARAAKHTEDDSMLGARCPACKNWWSGREVLAMAQSCSGSCACGKWEYGIEDAARQALASDAGSKAGEELERLKGRAEHISHEEASELQSVLRTLAPTGRALIHSARDLVGRWEKQTKELADLTRERDELRSDKERLDWVEGECYFIGHTSLPYRMLWSASSRLNGGHLRDNIDAARHAIAPEKEGEQQ